MSAGALGPRAWEKLGPGTWVGSDPGDARLWVASLLGPAAPAVLPPGARDTLAKHPGPRQRSNRPRATPHMDRWDAALRVKKTAVRVSCPSCGARPGEKCVQSRRPRPEGGQHGR